MELGQILKPDRADDIIRIPTIRGKTLFLPAALARFQEDIAFISMIFLLFKCFMVWGYLTCVSDNSKIKLLDLVLDLSVWQLLFEMLLYYTMSIYPSSLFLPRSSKNQGKVGKK